MGLNSRQLKHRQKDRLFEDQGGKCYYCGCQMLLTHTKQPHPPKNLATIEHLIDRLHPDREKPPVGKRHVLACLKCNNELGAQRYRELVIGEQRKRSGRFPSRRHMFVA